MSTPASNTLKSQYAEKVTADLQQNTAEQERIRAEVASLQERLGSLEQDHELLVGMRTALGHTDTVPAPRRTRKKNVAPAKSPSAKKAAAPKKPTAKTTTPATKTNAKKTTPAGEKAAPLTDLIHAYLSGQSEPRTAGEITKALTAVHPQRNISDNLVRTTTERLVARSRVERSKQGATVYYTISKQDDSASTVAPAEKEPAPAGA